MNFQEILQDTMESENGRQLIYGILEMTGINDTAVFTANGTVNAYYQGQRAVGSELLNNIRKFRDGFELECMMRKEARARPKTPKKKQVFYDNFIGSNEV